MHEQRIERVRRRFAQVVLRRELQRRIGEDRREVIALPCAFLALSQFFDDAGLGVKLRQETVNFVDAAVLLNERHRRHAARKTQGCYRELMPTLEYVKQEQKQEKPSIRDQLRTAAKQQPEKKSPVKSKTHDMEL